MTKRGETTRRGFMAAIGVGAAALAVPARAVAARGSGPAAYIPGLREWYASELERFMQDVKPEIAAGTMGRPIERPGRAWDADYAPMHRLEEAIRDRFGLHTAETDASDGGVWIDGDAATAYLVLAVAATTEEMGSVGWDHPAHYAAAVISEDVLQEAARRGWIERKA